MELSTILWKSDTSELERASKVIAGLVTDVAKLDKASRDAAQTEAILAKAAKSNADANLQNAKAQDVRLKSTIAADKADKANEQSVVKKTKAIEKETEVTSKNVGVLQKQKDILEFQTQGYSKGQAGILAYGKAAGLATADIQELGKVLETQRKLMGGDPFDKSLSGIKSLQNQYTELKESLRQYNTDSELSAKQTRELARDKERLIEKMKVEGASFQDIRKAVRAHNDEYVNLAGQYNKLSSAEDAVVKSRKEMVQATNYVTQAEQKMAAALSTTNAAIDKAGTDSLVKYENALRKSGVAQDVATAKLAAYKTQLTQVQAQEMKRREQHLARALPAQFTDIGVSLYSGQNPLTVMLQQSGQILDIFQLSGVEATKFGETMKRAFYSMVPAIATVAKGLGGLVVGLTVDAGKGITNFIGNITGINLAMESAKRALASGGEENFKYIASLQKLGNIAAATSAILAGGLVLSLIAMAVGLKQIISENNELAKSLALNNGNLAITQSSAVEYVRLLGEMGVTTGKATEAISAMAKEGKFTRDEILLVGKAASDMAKYADVAIEDTVKSFAKLKDKPVEGLIELAQKTGMVSPEVIKLVIELEKQGKIAEATAISMKALGSVTETQVAQMKENYNGFTLFILELGSKIKQFFSDTFKVLFLATDPTQQLQDNLGKVQERIKEVRENLEGNSKVLNFLGIGTDTKLLDSLKEQERQILKNIDRQVSANQVKEQEIALNVQNAKVQGVERELSDKADKAIDKQKDKLLNMEDYRKKFVQDKLADYAKEKNIDIEALRGNEKILSVLKEQADVEFKKIHKKESNAAAKQGNKDLETEIDLRNKALGLLGSFNNELDAIERRRAKSGDEDQYQKSLNALIEKQPIYLERQKEINDAHELSNKLMGKSEGLGKDYYKTLEQIQRFQDEGLYSPEKAGMLRQAAFDATQLAREQLKYIEDSTQASQKYAAEVQKSLGDNQLQNKLLDDRVALLGLTSEQARLVTREQDRKNKLLKVELDYQDKILKLKNDDKLDPFDREKAILDAMRVRTEEEKTINREVAVQAAEDFDAEFRKIKEGVTDSIVTALFEGGKAGSKKLRDVLVNVLRQKVTMVVDVGVNAFMNSLIGGSAGSVAGSAGSSILSSLATSVGGSALTSSLGISGLFTGGAVTAASNAALGVSLGLGSSSAAAAASGAAIAGGTSAGVAGAAGSMGTALAAIPGWGWAIAGIAALAGLMGKKSTPHMGASSTYSSLAGLVNTNLDAPNAVGFSAKNDAGTKTLTDQVARTLVDVFDTTAKTFGKVAGYEITTAFADDSSKDGAWGQLIIKQAGNALVNWSDTQSSKWAPKVFSDGEAGQKEYFAAIALSAREALVTAIGDVPWATDMLTALGASPSVEQLSQVVAQINATATALEFMRKNLVGFTDYTDVSIGKLIAFAGGVDNLTKSVQSYYENFYTETERTANATRDVTEALNKMGFELPLTRDGFRTLVEQQQALGESGVETVAALLRLSSAFASITPVIDTVTQAADDLAAAEKRRADEAAQAAAQAAQAAEEAKRRAEEIARVRLGLENELLQLLGNTTELRRREIEALDESNRALKEHIYAVQDARDAYKTSVEEAQSAYNLLERSVSAERKILDDKFNAQKSALEKETSLKAEALQAQVQSAQASADKIRSIAGMLQNALGALRVDSPQLDFARLNNARAVISQAASSSNIFDPGLESALGVFGEDNKKFYGKFEEFAFAQGVTAGEVAKLNESAKQQLSVADAIVQGIQSQIEAEKLLAETQLAAMQAAYDEEIAKLEESLALGKSQLDALLGIDNSVVSVKEAMDRLSGAINASNAALQAQRAAEATASLLMSGAYQTSEQAAAGAQQQRAYSDDDLRALGFDPADIKAYAAFASANGVADARGGLSSVVDSIIRAGQDAIDRATGYSYATNTDASGSRYADTKAYYDTLTDAQRVTAAEAWTNSDHANGISEAELRTILSVGTVAQQQLYSSSSNLDLERLLGVDGSHADGLAYVPFDGYRAELHMGERVLNADEARLYTPSPVVASMLQNGASNADLAAALRAMAERLDAIEANTRATAGHTAGTDRKLNRVVQNDAIRIETTI